MDKYKTNLEEIARIGNARNGSLYSSPSELVAHGYLTLQEGKDLEGFRAGTFIDVAGAVILPGGIKAPSKGRKPIADEAKPPVSGANGGGKAPGEIKILQGATPDANELRAGKGLSEQFGYDVAHQPTASQLGVQGQRTADLTVKGVGQVDVYTPNSTNPTSITRAIEGKNTQANAVLVQTSIGDADMAAVAARTWGKSTTQNIQTIFFQKPDGSIVRFNRPTRG